MANGGWREIKHTPFLKVIYLVTTNEKRDKEDFS